VSGGTPLKPLTSNRGHPWAARHRGPHGRVCRLFCAGPGGRKSGRRGPASRYHGTFVRLAKSRFRGRKAHLGEDLVMAKGQFGEVPRPLVSAPSRPHRLLVTSIPPGSWVLGRLYSSHARLGPICGLMHGHAQAEEACRVVEKATRFMLIGDLWGAICIACTFGTHSGLMHGHAWPGSRRHAGR
jgi:hypothetical protein